MKQKRGMVATKSMMKPSIQLIFRGIEQYRHAPLNLSLAGGVDRVNPREGRGKFIVVGIIYFLAVMTKI